MPVRSWSREGTDVCACCRCWPVTGPPRVHCWGLYGTEDGFRAAMGEAGIEGAAYVAGELATKGENGRLKDEAVAGVCNEPCRNGAGWGGARAVVRSGGCTAMRLRRGGVCGACKSPGAGACGGGGGGGGSGARGAG